ncbi:hypothetical protein L7F22_000985 [Adiantum nelumboides]|nr:hypothetical protein [Adiantum nelumboides]
MERLACVDLSLSLRWPSMPISIGFSLFYSPVQNMDDGDSFPLALVPAHTSSQAAMELLELNNVAQMDFNSLFHSFQTTADYSRMVDEGFYDEAHGIDIVHTQVHSKRKACLNEDEIIVVRKYEAQAKREYRKRCRARKQVQPSINIGAKDCHREDVDVHTKKDKKQHTI